MADVKLRVLIAEDHAVVREGLKALIDARGDMEVVGEAEDGDTACQKSLALRPDVVVLDLTLPGLDGIGAARHLKAQWSEVRIVALTVHEDVALVRAALEAGVRGYVLKRSVAAALILAIRTVSQGKPFVDSALAGAIVDHLAQRPDTSIDTRAAALTDRERDVVRLLAWGHTNKEVAARLNLSVKTVETYKARAMGKLEAASRADLVRYAVQQGWLKAL